MTSGLSQLITASHDIVLLNSVLQYLGPRQLPNLVESLFRITRPGGYIIIADVQDAALKEQAMADRIKNYVGHQDKVVGTGNAADVSKDTRSFFYRQEFFTLGDTLGAATTQVIDTAKDLKITQFMYFNAPYSYTVVYKKNVRAD